MMKLYLFFVLWVCLLRPSLETKASTESLARIFKSEENVVNNLENMMHLLEEEMSTMHKYIKDYHWIMDQDAPLITLVSHPINGYHIIKRLVRGWETVEETRENMKTVIDDVFNDVMAFREKFEFPKELDLKIAAQSLTKAQDVFKLDAEALTEGRVQHKGKEFNGLWKLSIEDCMYLGDNAAERDIYESALAFYGEALRKSRGEDKKNREEGRKSPEEGTHITTKQVEELIYNTTIKFRDYTPPEEGVFAQFSVDYGRGMEIYERVSRLCRGETLLAEDARRSLSCRYITNDNPYLLLGPMKLEEVSLHPAIAQFHDIVYESEMETIKDYAVPKLDASPLYPRTSTYTNRQSHTISDVALLSSRRLTDKIAKRITAATGLKTRRKTSAEAWQIATYGLGGQFNAHYDNLQQNTPFVSSLSYLGSGDRIATVALYLSDVEIGGATTFPKAGVAVFPKKGSAALWWNLLRNGKPDPLSMHSGCPVIVGTKWIVIKSIRENNQMWNAPCYAEQNKTFDATFWK